MILSALSDIHIKNTQRYQEYKEVFDRLFISLKQNKVDAIFVVGDVFHSKTKLSPESVELGFYLFEGLLESTDGYVVVVPGNHDLSLKNPHRLDSIYPIITEITKSGEYENRIIYSRKSENIDIRVNNQDVKIGHYCLTDTTNWDKVEPSNIALFHGTVDNCKTDIGFVIQNTGVTTDMFKEHDIVMLGDIHKHQLLESNICYCGSLLTQDFSESLYKGWVKWNIKDWKNFDIEHIPIQNNYSHYTLIIKEDGSFPTASEIPRYPVLRVYCQDSTLSPSDIKELEQRIITRYHPSEIRSIQTIDSKIKIKSFNEIEVCPDIENVYDPSIQADYINQFYNGKIEDDIIDELIQLNNSYQTQLPTVENIRNVRWKINHLTFSNFGKYGNNNVIRFDQLKGITGILGRNRVGKSTIIGSIVYALFKETVHPSLNTEDLINNTGDDMEIVLDINIGVENYVIKRTLKIEERKDRATKETTYYLVPELDFYKIVDSKQVSLNGDTKWETEANIRAVFGNADDFKLTSYSQQNQGLELIDDKRGKERKEILSRFLGIDVFSKLRDINKPKMDNIEGKIKNVNITDLLRNRNTYQNKIDSNKKTLNKLSDDIDSKKKEIEKIEKIIDDIRKQLQPIDDELLKNNREDIDKTINNNQVEIENIGKQIQQKIKERDAIDSTLKKAKLANDLFPKLQPVIEQLKIHERELSELQSDKKIVESSITALERSVAILTKQPWCRERKCLFLQDALQSESELEIKKNELEEIEKKINSKVNDIENLQPQKAKYDSLIELQLDIQHKKDRYVETQQSINQFEQKRQKIESENSHLLGLLERINQNTQRIEHNKNINKQLQEQNTLLTSENTLLLKLNNEFNKLFVSMQADEFALSSYEDDIRDYKENEKQLTILKLYHDAVDVNGIPLSIIKNILPLLNVEINRLLFNVDFTLSLETNNEGTEIITYIIDNKSKRRIESASGMEKIISSFAIRSALIEMSSLPKPNFLIIDEGFGALDSDSLANIGRLFEQLKQKFEHVLVISHISDVQDFCDSTISISVDDDGNSFIEEIR